jgi:hypothetical protein
MPESLVQVTEGSGKKLHTWQRTIGANAVEDEVILHGEPMLATYTVATASALSVATAASHVLQIMAGASLNVYIRRIRVYQFGLATTAAIGSLQLFRLSTAGTGGTALTPAPHDADPASGATAMTLPTVKGTEGTIVGIATAQFIQTVPTGGVGAAPLLASWDFDNLKAKGLRIPAGATNGIAIKNATATAAATVVVEVVFVEANY